MSISKLKFIQISGLTLLLILKFVLFQSTYLHAQSPDFRFNNIYKEDGLPSNDVKGIVKDKLGFLWIATTNGLCRYDAKGRIKVFQTDVENNRLHASAIECIFKDSRGFLWVGTRQGGLTRIDVENDTWTTYRQEPDNPNSLAHDDIIYITEDNEGQIWIGTEGGVNIFYPDTERFVTFRADKTNPSALQANAVLSILVDKEGMVWLGTWNGGLHLFLPDKDDITKSTFRNFIIPGNGNHRIIWAIRQDRTGRYWVGEEYGLTYMQVPADATNEATKQAWKPNFHIYKNKDGSSLRQIRSILQDNHNNLWCASLLGGVNLIRRDFLPDTKHFLPLTRDKPKLQIQNFVADENDFFSISNNAIFHVYEDNQQLIWFCTSKGLSQFDWRSRQFDIIQPALQNNALLSVMTSEGIAFSINGAPDIYIYDVEKGTTKKIELPESGLDKEGFKRINSNDDGSISLLSKDGIRVYDMTKGIYSHKFLFKDYSEYFDIKQAAEIRFIFHKDKFWIRGRNGLAVFDTRNNKFKTYDCKPDDKHTLVDNAISRFQLDNDGNLWISTWGGISILSRTQLELSRLPDAFKFKNYKSDNAGKGFISNKIATIHHTPKRMYMGSQNGLMSYEYDTQEFIDRTNQDNVFSIYSIYEWKKDDIWMSIEGGIVNYDGQKEIYKVYHSKYGINNINLRDGKSYTDGKGGLYFTGANTVIKVKPDEFMENETPPIVSITNAQILNKDGEKSANIINAEQLSLYHGDNRLALSFSALNYDSPEKNRYAYQLEGFDEDWIYTKSTEPVVYTNLKAGNYTLKVKASNNDGVWNEKGASLKIIKKPAFWETKVFITALLLLTILVIFLGVRSYNRHLVWRYKEIASYNKKLNTEITERKKAEETLQIKNEELINTNKDLEQFAYICSHDLKEPIRGIHSFVNLVERKTQIEPLKEEVTPYFGYIYNYLKTLQNIITSLGIFTRVNQGENFTRKPIQINDVFKKVKSNLMELVREKNATLHFTNSTDIQTIYNSEYALILVLQNLVQNGIKYNTSINPNVSVNVTLQDDDLCFSVSDNGIGIKDEYLEYIFKPFKTLENKNKNNSSGLGLAICARIIAQLEGKIWVESTFGKGSTFYIMLKKNQPLVIDEEPSILTGS